MGSKRLTGMPLADRLLELIALKGSMSLTQAMAWTGVVLPAVKGGDCGHQLELAADGRCLSCKREADQRLYRNRQYKTALGSLVARGLVRESKDRWVYAGPVPIQRTRKPKLPAETPVVLRQATRERVRLIGVEELIREEPVTTPLEDWERDLLESDEVRVPGVRTRAQMRRDHDRWDGPVYWDHGPGQFHQGCLLCVLNEQDYRANPGASITMRPRGENVGI